MRQESPGARILKKKMALGNADYKEHGRKKLEAEIKPPSPTIASAVTYNE
jgi:hypothetical protein